jgi:hypothetical protein
MVPSQGGQAVKTSTETLIKAMRILSSDIQSDDGVANAAIAEAAQRLAEQQERIKRLEEAIEGTIKWIVDLANSGDAGFWNPEEQSVIIAARAALNKEAKP